VGAGAPSLKGLRVLVVRNDRIGDLVLALPLVEGLHRAGAFVGVLASKYAAPLVEADPRVGRLIVDGPGARREIRAAGFDAALVLWANARNAWNLRRAGVPRIFGPGWRPFSPLFHERLNLRRGRGWEHESELNYAFGRALGLEGEAPPPRLRLSGGARLRARAYLSKTAPKGAGPLVGLHPGSRGSAQPWPVERFAALGRELARRHGARLLVTAGPGEEDQARECARLADSRCAVCTGLGLQEFAAALGELDLFAACSTGPLHLAAAGGAPVLGLYPPLRAMSPLRWAPRGSRRAVLSPAGLGFRIPPSPGVNYVERIGVEEAAAACVFLLRGKKGGPHGTPKGARRQA